MAEPWLGWLNPAFEARQLDDDSQALELEEERKNMTKLRKLLRAAPLCLPDDIPLPCRDPRLYGGRGPYLHQRTHKDHTESVRCRCAVDLAAMAISKSSIKFGKLASLVVCPKGTTRNSDTIQSDNKNFSKPT